MRESAEPRPDSGTAAGRGVLEGAFGLLEVLARGGDLGLTEAAAAAGLPKATASRLLAQLVALDAVQRRARRYRIGPALHRLGLAWRPDPVLRKAAHLPLQDLSAATKGASLGLAVPASGNIVIVGGLRGEADDVFPLRAGLVLPPGSAADVLFAPATEGAADPPADYSRREWRRMVIQAREQGLAFDYEVGAVSCVAAPVHAPSGAIVAAVGAVVLDRRRVGAIAADVHHAANLVSANLARHRPG